MFKYAIKRVFRGYRLFIALTIGVLIATTFFSSMLLSADVISSEAVRESLAQVGYDASIQANNVTWSTSEYDDVQAIIDGLPEVQSTDRYTKLTFDLNSTLHQSFDVFGVDEASLLWRSLTFINGSTTLSANETLVVASSKNATALSLGQVIRVPVRYLVSDFPFVRTFEVNLTVAGFCDVTEDMARLMHPPRTLNLGFISIPLGDWRDYDLMLVDWASTIAPLLTWYSAQENTTRLLMSEGFFVQLDRATLINPYDLSGSVSNIQAALAKIEDRASAYNTQTTNLVGGTLTMLSLVSTVLILTFVALAAPIIFMSWYSSTMLSDVSYNLRRREFGLLQTKGFGPRSIRSMLNFEGIIIGLVGGIAGLLVGTFVAHQVAGVPIESPFIVLATSPLNSLVVVAFGMILAYWSIRGPASRASMLDPLDSLKQYVYIEEQSEYRKLLPRIALLLGTYKIVVWALGINMTTVLVSALSSNFILFIAVAIWSPVDSFLNFVGPIFFLFGLTKILLRGSQRFQEWVVSAGKRFFGAFGNLATRNVRRNPARNAALVFVVSLIVSYGLYSVGSLFSEQDQRYRLDLYSVGSDVSAEFPAGTNITSDLPLFTGLDGVAFQTVEYRLTLSTTRGALETRGIDSSSWQEAAYHEDGWFSGNTFSELMSGFTGHKILLSVTVARQLQLRVGNNVTVKGPTGSVYRLAIVGLVGYVSPLEGLLGQFAFGGAYPSYVPVDFLNSSDVLKYAVPRILLKTDQGVNGTRVEQEITNIAPTVSSTDSMTSRAVQATGVSYEMGNTRARWLGVLFAAVLAVVGTGLVVSLTLREKEYETTLLSVRGFSKGQVLRVLIAEVMVMIMFSLVLGTLTGFIQLFGGIASSSQSSDSLVRPQMVLDPTTLLFMSAIVIGVVISAIVPILFASRFSERKIDVLRE